MFTLHHFRQTTVTMCASVLTAITYPSPIRLIASEDQCITGIIVKDLTCTHRHLFLPTACNTATKEAGSVFLSSLPSRLNLKRETLCNYLNLVKVRFQPGDFVDSGRHDPCRVFK